MAIFAEEPEVRTQLERLGIPLAGLLGAIARGGGAHASTTELHASSAGGTYLYHETTFALRLLLSPLGWICDEADGQPRCFSTARGISIVVQTGDEFTGIDGAAEPMPRHPKGLATQRKVNENTQQLALFNFAAATEDATSGPGLTWILLVVVDQGMVRAELSLPNALSADKRPCGWLDRILLPGQAVGGGGVPFDISEPGDEGPETDIDVAWKQ